jgi:hypothetical protein
MYMRRYRIAGAAAAVLLIAGILVPILIDRPDTSNPPEPSAEPTRVIRAPVDLPSSYYLPNLSAPPTPRVRSTLSSPPPAATSRPGHEQATRGGSIQIPVSEPPGLPEQGVPPGVLVYGLGCEKSTTCRSWRLLDWSGRHWVLPAGTATTISPNGRRIAFFRPNGQLVVHDLASGAEGIPVSVPPTVLAGLRPHITWSANSRWLAIDYVEGDTEQTGTRQATQVDTTTMRSQQLGLPCCVLGIHSETGRVLVDDRYQVLSPAAGHRWLNPDGSPHKRIPRAPGLSQLDWSQGRTAYPLAPDGSRYAIHLWDKWGTDAVEIGVIDAESGQLTDWRPLPRRDLYEVVGWSDRDTVLLRFGDMTVYGINVNTWKLTTIYTFPIKPDILVIATELPRAP